MQKPPAKLVGVIAVRMRALARTSTGWIIAPLTLTDRRAMIRRPAVWQHASVPPYVTCTGKGRQFNGAPLPTQSQGDRVLMQIPSPAVQESLTWLTDSLDQVLDETVHLCQIPAPTFEEAERAAYVAERMRTIGLREVQIDTIHNVSGILSAGTPGPTTLVAAHLDTVFPRATPLQVRRTKQRLYGPGIGDNCVAVAAMLGVAEIMCRLQLAPPGRVIFAASVGEEGLGNLCGIRALLEAWPGQIDTVIAVEGHGIDEVRTTGIGSTRLEITFEGPGGHSWGAFGTPSAIHAMGTAIHKIAHLQVPKDPKTTFNVGVVDGGGSVNTIAPRATMLVDLRSLQTAQLARIEHRVARLLQEVQRDTGVQVHSRIVGKR